MEGIALVHIPEHTRSLSKIGSAMGLFPEHIRSLYPRQRTNQFFSGAYPFIHTLDVCYSRASVVCFPEHIRSLCQVLQLLLYWNKS